MQEEDVTLNLHPCSVLQQHKLQPVVIKASSAGRIRLCSTLKGEIKVFVVYDDNSWIKVGLNLDYITSTVIIFSMGAGLNCV